MKWRIRNYKEVDTDGAYPLPLYWSNKDGWVTIGYDIFEDYEMTSLALPLGGYWEPDSTLVVFYPDFPVPVRIYDDENLDVDSIELVYKKLLYEDMDRGEWREEVDVIHKTMEILGITNYNIEDYNYIGED